MVNFSEIIDELSARIDLDNYKKEAFAQKVDEFFVILNHNLETSDEINSFEAVEILFILASFKENFISELKWESLVYRCLEIIRNNIYSQNYSLFSVYTGIGSIAFALQELLYVLPNIQRFQNNINDLLCMNLDKYLEHLDMPDFTTVGNFELIEGITGPLRYLLDYVDNEKMYNMASKLVEILVKRSQSQNIDDHSIPGWFYKPSSNEAKNMSIDTNIGVINYGVSHGMGGPLMTLSLAYKKGIQVDGIEKAIDSIFTEYNKAAFWVNDIIYWPRKITLEQYIGQKEIITCPNPMSWCYGSIGILRVMYLTSMYTQNKKIKMYAINNLKKIAEMKISDYMLLMPVNCHGYAGTVSIMSEMYYDTKIDAFLNMAKKQLVICVDYIINADYLKCKKEAGKVSLYSYLEGYSGILQTIKSFVKSDKSTNKKRILIQ